MKNNKITGVILYIIAIIINAIIHFTLFFIYNFGKYGILYFIISFIAFTHTFCFIIDFVWSVIPSISSKLSGKIKVNELYYMNTTRKDVNKDLLPDVTISIPVYLEENKIIFETIKESIKAVKNYTSTTGKNANIIVSDDGIGTILKDKCNKHDIDELLLIYKENSYIFSPEMSKVIQRINFYRKHEIGFVIRPPENRAGHFKKASNLNYTLLLGDELEKGINLKELVAKGGAFEKGYAEGNIKTNEVILLLDKDSGLKPSIIKSIVPEFIYDNKLAYVQCATKTANISDNFFTKITGKQTNDLFNNTLPCQALKGFFVPLVGHNVFIRKSALKENGYWSENKVAEDFDAAIRFNANGFHGKYAQLKNLEFTEYTSRTFTEETHKQYRYIYGLFEMLIDGTIKLGKTRNKDIFYMIIYFISKITNVILIPYTLFIAYIGNLDIMGYGFIFCYMTFTMLPFIRKLLMKKQIKKEYLFTIKESMALSLLFIGHGFALFAGACRYIINKITNVQKAFPATSVSTLNYNFKEGLILMKKYIMKNKYFVIVSILCIERIINIFTSGAGNILNQILCTYLLGGVVIVPFAYTPHFYDIKTKENNISSNKLNLICRKIFKPIYILNNASVGIKR